MGQDDERDFAAILAEFERGRPVAAGGDEPRVGDRVGGRVLSIGDDSVFVDVGAKADAMVPRAELADETGGLTVAVGDALEALVVGRDPESGCILLRARPGGAAGGPGSAAAGAAAALAEVASAHQHGLPVEGTVKAAVKGGVEVTVAGLTAFCPISQLDLAHVDDAAAWAGRRLTFLVTRFEASGRGGRPNVVLSRRELLKREADRRRAEALARLAPGAVVRGTVTSVTAYGAFVDIGDVEGLLHVSEMAHGRVSSPADLVRAGDSLEVEVLSIEERDGQTRVALSRRALERDPWEGVAQRFPPGLVVPGRVVRLESFGAFVEVAPGLEGLVHLSELAPGRRVHHAREVVTLGEDVTVRVLEAAPERRRLSLALAAPAEAAGEAPAGGAEESPGFGAMADFFDRSRK